MLPASPFVVIIAKPDYKRPTYRKITGCGYKDFERAKDYVRDTYKHYIEICYERRSLPTFRDFEKFWYEDYYMECDPVTFEYFEDGAWHNGESILKNLFRETLETWELSDETESESDS